MKKSIFIFFLTLLVVFSIPAYASANRENKNEEEKLSFSDVKKHEKYITTTKSFKIDGEILDEIPYKEGEFEGKLSRQDFVDIDYDKNIKTYKFGGWIQDKEYKEVAAAFKAQSKEAQFKIDKNIIKEIPLGIKVFSNGTYERYVEIERTFAFDADLPYEIMYVEGNMGGPLTRQRLVSYDERWRTKTYIYSGWIKCLRNCPTEFKKIEEEIK
ncbi:hypothetical protein [Peptoniphilus sp.]|uniref:hypothetical protein n=1 Tax=Peptoniphilus sp. TaxID=1971214 RepID=UPI003991010B